MRFLAFMVVTVVVLVLLFLEITFGVAIGIILANYTIAKKEKEE